MSKIQFLKAIHNISIPIFIALLLFQNVKDTIFESNSQHFTEVKSCGSSCFRMSKIQFLKAIHNNPLKIIETLRLFQNVKDTIFESNSQHLVLCFHTSKCCFRMSKIQFLKAIHNAFAVLALWRSLFQNVKDTIFESNSQQQYLPSLSLLCCFRMSKIQFLKAIHNSCWL